MTPEQQRIIELEALVAALTERLVKKDAPAAFTVAFRRMKAMEALLDQWLPHHYVNNEDGRGVVCVPDCPACAWARLKGSGELP